MVSLAEKRDEFRRLHDAGCWVIGNPFDVGSALLLQHLGYRAIATTSAGFAGAIGRQDGQVTLDDLAAHVSALNDAVDVPVHVDAERCFGADAAGVADAVTRLAEAGASGISIEDYNPAIDDFDPVDVSVERVAAAAEAAHAQGVFLTARSDLGFHRPVDKPLVTEVLDRLAAYRDAGADCLYAPGLIAPEHLTRVVELGPPVNVIILPGAPSVPELDRLGVRRVSTGSMLTWAAYGAFAEAARELTSTGTVGFTEGMLSRKDRAAFTLTAPPAEQA